MHEIQKDKDNRNKIESMRMNRRRADRRAPYIFVYVYYVHVIFLPVFTIISWIRFYANFDNFKFVASMNKIHYGN